MMHVPLNVKTKTIALQHQVLHTPCRDIKYKILQISEHPAAIFEIYACLPITFMSVRHIDTLSSSASNLCFEACSQARNSR